MRRRRLTLALAFAAMALAAVLPNWGYASPGPGRQPGELHWPPRAAVVDPQVAEALALGSPVAVIVSLSVPPASPGPASAGFDPTALVDSVAASQARVLEALPRGEFDVTRRYQAVPALAGKATATAVAALAAHPDVAHIALDREVHADLAQAVPLINADDVHNLFGITGNGVVVAVLDTGIDTDHPLLADDLMHGACFLTAGTCPGGGTTGNSAEDGHGHGTHVSGIITSAGPPIGIAPDAQIEAFKVLDDSGSGDFADVIAAYDHIITDHPEVDIINMSLGDGGSYGNCDTFIPALTSAIATTRGMGMTTFAASGNSGSKLGLANPACISDVVSVGAVYDANLGPAFCDSTTAADQVTCFSQSSVALDLLAPGSAITSTVPGGGLDTFSGTSMASPAAAAVAALLLDSESTLIPDDVEARLTETGVSILDAGNGVTACRVDAYEAVIDDGGPVCATTAPPPPECPAIATFSFSVPDALDAFGAGAPNHDIVAVSGEGDASTFCLTVDFAGPVDPADAGSGQEIIGFVEFDTDKDPGTGYSPTITDLFCPDPSSLGAENSLDLVNVSAGMGSLNGFPVPVVFDTTSFTAKIPLFAIGGDSGFNFGMVVGSLSEATDCAPGDGGCIESPGGLLCCSPADNDGDGLSGCDEELLGTDPQNPDTDGDGLSDGAEVLGFPSPKPALGIFFTNPLNPDTDGDICTDGQEVGVDQHAGGRRDPTNGWDYFNPTKDGQNRIDDVLAVLGKYFVDVSDPTSYSTQYDRTYLGPNPWNLGPPDGRIRIDDVLAALHQYYHDCG